MWSLAACSSIPLQYLSHVTAVAQREELWTCDQQVVGSNPTRGKAA